MVTPSHSLRPSVTPAVGDLLSRRLLIVAGKGGTGRTTVAAALAVLAARRGRRTLLAQVNAKERLGVLLGGPRVGEEIMEVRDHLHAVNMNPTAALREYGLMILRYESLYRAVLENRLIKGFLRAIPGLDDYSMLGKAWYHTTEEGRDGRPKYETVILDAPATGHAVTMLRLPQAILDSVPEGPLTETARRVRRLLSDGARTALVIVTLAEDLPVSEAVDLHRINEQLLRLPLRAVIVNQLWQAPAAGTGGAARVVALLEEGAAADPVLGPLAQRARTARTRQELNATYLKHLARQIPVPQLHLPYLCRPAFEAAELEEVTAILERQLPPPEHRHERPRP